MLTRVWNVTDDPATDVDVQNVVCLGQLLMPGRSMQVEEENVVEDRKVQKDVADGYLYIGNEPPAYLSVPRVTLPKGTLRGHGEHALPPPPEPEPEVKAAPAKAGKPKGAMVSE